MTPRHTLSIALSTLLLAPAIHCHAQNWTVGVPVDMLMHTQFFWGGCTPGTDYTFDHPPSPTAGVQYVMKITTMDPPTGSLTLFPDAITLGLGDEFVFSTSGEHAVVLAAGTTSAVAEFRAIGIPTHAGDPHVCTENPNWISNLGICPDALTPVVILGCTVQDGISSIAEALATAAIQWPAQSNGQQLAITLQSAGIDALSIMDVQGRVVRSKRGAGSMVLELGDLMDGAYLLSLRETDGAYRTARFVIAH
jgi:hypothetical protein